MQYSYGAFGFNAPNTSVDITGTSASPGSIAILIRNGVVVSRRYADPSTGVWHFYGVDDSGSQIYTIVTTTQSGGSTGEVWTSTVTSGVATTTKIFSSQRAVGYASAG